VSSRQRRRRPAGAARRLRTRLGLGWQLALVPVLGASVYGLFPRAKAGDSTPARAQRTASVAAVASQEQPRITVESRASMDRLSLELQQRIRRAPARMAAVYVRDIDTGLSAGANPDRKFLAASLIKLPVMAAAYELWEKRPELKTRHALRWLEWMITVSDNASTDRLIDLVGGPEKVIRFCEERGWPNLKVRHAIINHRGRRGLNECTAREVVELLAVLDQRQLVSEEADEEMWAVLRRQQKRARIPGGVPELPGVEVGNKTGTLGNALHDAGIVRTPRGRYAICILLSGQRSDAAGDRFCRQISGLVFDRLYHPEERRMDIARGQ
jgi:beta-lactamase class A